MNKNENQKEKLISLPDFLFSSFNWIYPINFFLRKRKQNDTLKLLKLSQKIYQLEIYIKESLFDFSRLMEEELWNIIFSYLVSYLVKNLNPHFLNHLYKDKENFFQKFNWEVLEFDKKNISFWVDEIVNNEKKFLKSNKFALIDEFVNNFLKKHEVVSQHSPKLSKEVKIATLLLSVPWYKYYLKFISRFLCEDITEKVKSKIFAKLLLLDDLNVQEKSKFEQIDEFVNEYGIFKDCVSEEKWFKLLGILGFIFNKVKSNSTFGDIIEILQNLKRTVIPFYFQKWPFSKGILFFKDDLSPETIQNIFIFAKKIRNFASHNENTKSFTAKNSKTPIEYMIFILEKIEFLDKEMLKHFKFELKKYSELINHLYEDGIFNLSEDYSKQIMFEDSKNILEKIKELFFGENKFKHDFLNLNKKEQNEYDKTHSQSK